jgi:hypothetical protein
VSGTVPLIAFLDASVLYPALLGAVGGSARFYRGDGRRTAESRGGSFVLLRVGTSTDAAQCISRGCIPIWMPAMGGKQTSIAGARRGLPRSGGLLRRGPVVPEN